MPRGGARPRPPGFGRVIAVNNKLRAERRKRQADEAMVVRERAAFRKGHAMRKDEQLFFKETKKADAKQKLGTRRNKDFTSEALVIASFDDEPALATGLKRDSVDRARLVVATALAQPQANEVPDRISDAASAIKVIKRSMDETPFYVKGATSRELTRVKALNQRCFFVGVANRKKPRG